jgi:Uma2 family endonuclease
MAYAPCLLVEVLSRSTGIKDRTLKLAAYTSLPSLRAYWIVSQTWRSVERHWRGADGVWRTDAVAGDDGALDVPCPARGALTLDEIYEGLDLPRTPPGGPPLRRVREPAPEFADA